MSSGILSVIPYYGGKAKMATLICEMLDYANTDIYIEPFGGGARVLLNKPRHKTDIYNDSSLGLKALFECLSKCDTGLKLIDDLMRTEPTKELFDWALKFRNGFDNSILKIANQNLKAFLKKMDDKYGTENTYKLFAQSGETLESRSEKIAPLVANMTNDEGATFVSLCEVYATANDDGIVNETGVDYYDNLHDLAKATFIVYQLSYSANGKGISKAKLENPDQFYRAVNNLYKAMAQLEGIQTICADAQTAFFVDNESVSDTTNKNAIFSMSWYLKNDRVMMYLDPSYLSPKSGVDLGKVSYKHWWNPAEHKKFLEIIRDAECHILLSNYDLPLYDKHLLGYKNWQKIKVETYTSASNSNPHDNTRVEVLWYNY